ncbi:hypothetical protein HON01_10175 [Candidatus Woesearchaeota archaeon]|nr:hypothetical protein [Candidatus Woesearchaeota archaeon]
MFYVFTGDNFFDPDKKEDRREYVKGLLQLITEYSNLSCDEKEDLIKKSLEHLGSNEKEKVFYASIGKVILACLESESKDSYFNMEDVSTDLSKLTNYLEGKSEDSSVLWDKFRELEPFGSEDSKDKDIFDAFLDGEVERQRPLDALRKYKGVLDDSDYRTIEIALSLCEHNQQTKK